jgi:TP901 family phage tail tape measure protein
MARGTLRVRIVGDARDLQKTLGNATGSLAKFARRGVLALGAATVAGVAASVRAFANFDQAMTNSVAIMGDVSDAMRKDMSDAAREVAKTTKFSATEAAESYFFLASAGMDAAQSIEALPRVAAFAQAGNFDMARATDLLTDAQSALGLVVDDTADNLMNLARVGDVLVGANTLANASVEQFSESLTEKAGAALRQLNKDVEEGVAVLAVYADAGVKGSAAGTQLNAVLEGLTRTARLNADAYKDLGVAVFDADGEMRNMADIIGDLETSLDGMSTEAQLAALAQLGLTRNARDGVVQLLGSADAIRDYETELRSMGGVVDEVANRQMQTFWAQLGLVKDQFVDVGLSIGEALMPALMEFAGWIQERLPAITSTMQGWADRFNELLTGTSGAVSENVAVMDGWAASAIMARDSVLTSYETFPDDMRYLLPKRADFEDFISTSGEAGDDAGADFMDRLRAAVNGVWNEEIKPWFDNTFIPWFRDDFAPRAEAVAYQAGESVGKALLEGLGNAGSALFNWLIEKDKELLRGWGIDLGRVGRDSGDDVGRSMGQGVQTGVEGMQGPVEGASSALLRGALRRAREEVGRNGSAAVPIGTSMLSGIRTGLTNSSALSGIASAASRAVTSALTAARRAMGVSSPSKVMAEELGVPMAQGVIAGLQSQADLVARAQLALVAPVEWSGAVNLPAGGAGRPSGGMPQQTIVVQLDGREIGRTTARHLPNEVKVRTGIRQ